MNAHTGSGSGSSARLDVESLLTEAREAAGLEDFGDPWFRQPLEHLVELVNTEGGLKSEREPPVLGLIGSLADRLRLVDYVKRHPAVLDERLDVACAIIGLPRGGSTLLQRLLGSSPQLTSTTCWELRFPVPLRGEVRGQPTARVAAGRAAIEALYAAWPDMQSMHPMEATTYDEEILLIDRSFLCLNYAHYFNVPSYDAWLPRQDHTKSYQELELWLKVLQYNAPDRRGRKWLLKSPHHLLGSGLRPLLRQFPGAKILMTHRSLESVIASYCSIQSLTVRSYSNAFDPAQSGRHAVALFDSALRNLIAVRAEHGAARFIDVQYRKLLSSPLGEFRRALHGIGLEVTPADEAAAAGWIAANGRDSHPRHSYRLEDYGITAAALQETFRFYSEAFLR
jgi:hypothetical protein